MKILIISRTPWNLSNSFGNTFSNLFNGMQNVEIYHICCQHGATDNSPAKQTFQMSDRSILHSIIHRKGEVGWFVDSENECNYPDNTNVSESITQKKRIYAYYARDLIWKLGAWKHNETLNSYLKEIQPDILYLPIYASGYMCEFQMYVAGMLHVPCIGHISDDVFAKPRKSALLNCYYYRKVAKKLRKLIKRCSYLEVFAENMQRQYSEMFHKPVYLIGKGVDVKTIRFPPVNNCNSEMHFVYTGNIGADRYHSLVLLGKALSEYKGRVKGVLDIYSASMLSKAIKEEFAEYGSIVFHGAVSADQIPQIQEKANVLVHVEGFSSTAVATTRMSFSTKLIDYMVSGNLIFAIGDSEINSIAVLSKFQLAIVADSPTQIYSKTTEILDGAVKPDQFRSNIMQYLITYRDRAKIQEGIKGRIESVIRKDESITG